MAKVLVPHYLLDTEAMKTETWKFRGELGGTTVFQHHIVVVRT